MNKLKEWAFGVSTDGHTLGNQFRQKRMMFFKEQLEKLPKPVRILDVGGNEDFWVNAKLHNNQDIQIKILNLELEETNYPNLEAIKGDATDLSEYKDGEFDIAFSNSVIEHLYSKENQVKMANEITRVGKFHYVQTPNKYFIIEPHYLLPFFQFLPKKFRFFVLTRTKLSRSQRWSSSYARQYLDEIVLLSRRDMKRLFPKSSIWVEKFFGMSKSFVVHNFN